MSLSDYPLQSVCHRSGQQAGHQETPDVGPSGLISTPIAVFHLLDNRQDITDNHKCQWVTAHSNQCVIGLDNRQDIIKEPQVSDPVDEFLPPL